MKGFSLVELVIVVAIIALIGGLVTIRFTQVNERTAARNGTIDLTIGLKEARTSSLVGRAIDGESRSWGVYIDISSSQQAWIFADVDEDGTYTSATDDGEWISMDPQSQIGECQINGVSLTTCAVYFSAPSAEARLFTNDTSPADPLTTLQITIESRGDTSVEEQVTVTAPSGLIVTSVQL